MDRSTQNLKDMIQRMTELDAVPADQRKQLDEMASMNVSMSGETADEVASLMRMMQNAGMNDAAPVTQDNMPVRQDMERLAGIMSEPEMPEMPEMPGDDEPEMSLPGQSTGDDEQDAEDEDEDDVENSSYDNAPDEDYQDAEYMTKDISGGLNKQKKSYKPTAGGDNPMAVENIKDRLYARLSEKKEKPDFADIDGDGDKKEPMKKAAKDKKASKKQYSKCIMALQGAMFLSN